MVELLLAISQVQLVAQDFKAKERNESMLDAVALGHLPNNHCVDADRCVNLNLLLLNVAKVVCLKLHESQALLLIEDRVVRLRVTVAHLEDDERVACFLFWVSDDSNEVADLVLLAKAP